MKVLLVTTSTNSVRTVLEQNVEIELSTIDCNVYGSHTLEMIKRVIKNSNLDLLITYRCPIVFPKDIFESPRLGAFNIHPSLLPKYSGLNPWEEIFRDNERKSGVTLHQMTEKVDAGEIVFQYPFIIKKSDTIDSARIKADQLSAKLALNLIEYLCCLY